VPVLSIVLSVLDASALFAKHSESHVEGICTTAYILHDAVGSCIAQLNFTRPPRSTVRGETLKVTPGPEGIPTTQYWLVYDPERVPLLQVRVWVLLPPQVAGEVTVDKLYAAVELPFGIVPPHGRAQSVEAGETMIFVHAPQLFPSLAPSSMTPLFAAELLSAHARIEYVPAEEKVCDRE
jgi:hypothetical protein